MFKGEEVSGQEAADAFAYYFNSVFLSEMLRLDATKAK